MIPGVKMASDVHIQGVQSKTQRRTTADLTTLHFLMYYIQGGLKFIGSGAVFTADKIFCHTLLYIYLYIYI